MAKAAVERTRICPGCGHKRAESAFWIEADLNGMFHSRPPKNCPEIDVANKKLLAYICEPCRSAHVPPPLLKDPREGAPEPSALDLTPLSFRDRLLLKGLASGMEVGDAERMCGYRAGGAVRRKLLFSADFRTGMMELLLEQGLDRQFMVGKLKEFATAMKKVYGKNGPIDEIPDYQTQVKAVDLMTRIFGITIPVKEGKEQKTSIHIHTNLGTEVELDAENEIVVTVKGGKKQEIIDVTPERT